MIRINLLPVKQVKKVQAGQRQLMIFALAVFAEVVLLFLFYQMAGSEVEDRRRKSALLQSDVDQLQKAVGDFDKLKKQHDELLAQKKVILDLQKGRTGPVWMLHELANLLTPGKGPTIDRASYEELLRNNPNAGYNSRWNPHRLWLEELKEHGGLVRLRGFAKDYDDVAEFSKRIHLSKYFTDDFLERNDLVDDKNLGQRLVRFSLRARLRL